MTVPIYIDKIQLFTCVTKYIIVIYVMSYIQWAVAAQQLCICVLYNIL